MTLNDFMIITGLTLNHTASLDLPKTMSRGAISSFFVGGPKVKCHFLWGGPNPKSTSLLNKKTISPKNVGGPEPPWTPCK